MCVCVDVSVFECVSSSVCVCMSAKYISTLTGRRKSKRKLIFNGHLGKTNNTSPPPEVMFDSHTDKFLSEMAQSWRQARRNMDRSSAAIILQMTLKGIPKGHGRVSDWLGSKYFDEVKTITSGCRVRVLSPRDHALGTRHRNKFQNSCLGKYNTKS